ncbi:TetR/AcrR family transcriptional regulator [Nonomuraea rhizosphaerae]|uniref:TetR/AcrR family transcriptional regulator n=1 Tax=Nonomuraea rhizosphaerae TaxID=2665663 RepID=UPI001C5F08D6|nr:TetR/AcrR family transcriptional regulator [Nonomuraea rhizosphaerae]
MARAALSREAVVDLAVRIVDEDGPAALTLSAVAARAGVATPSLYKHVRNLADLRELLSARVLGEMADHVGAAVLGRSGDEALRALMDAWRSYVTRHPGRYATVIQAPVAATVEPGKRLVDIGLAALRAYGLTGSEAIHAVRCLRAAAHGFSVLETAGGFGLPEKLDDTYELMFHMIVSGLRAPR